MKKYPKQLTFKFFKKCCDEACKDMSKNYLSYFRVNRGGVDVEFMLEDECFRKLTIFSWEKITLNQLHKNWISKKQEIDNFFN